MDLNLVRIFISVYETGSLTKTARTLFVCGCRGVGR